MPTISNDAASGPLNVYRQRISKSVRIGCGNRACRYLWLLTVFSASRPRCTRGTLCEHWCVLSHVLRLQSVTLIVTVIVSVPLVPSEDGDRHRIRCTSLHNLMLATRRLQLPRCATNIERRDASAPPNVYVKSSPSGSVALIDCGNGACRYLVPCYRVFSDRTRRCGCLQ